MLGNLSAARCELSQPRRIIMCMPLIAALAVIWSLLGQ